MLHPVKSTLPVASPANALAALARPANYARLLPELLPAAAVGRLRAVAGIEPSLQTHPTVPQTADAHVPF